MQKMDSNIWNRNELLSHYFQKQTGRSQIDQNVFAINQKFEMQVPNHQNLQLLINNQLYHFRIEECILTQENFS